MGTLTATAVGRLGPYTVTIVGDDVTTGTLRLAEHPRLRYEGTTGTLAFGPLASWCELLFEDPDGVLFALFGGYFDETDYLVTVATDDGAYEWRGFPMQAELDATAAPLLYPIATTTLRVYDRLGALGEKGGNPVATRHLGRVVRDALQVAHPLSVCYVGLNLWPQNANTRSLADARFTEEVFAGGDGDYGTARKHLETLCLAWSARLFQPLGASYHSVNPATVTTLLLHVPYIGTAVDVTRVQNNSAAIEDSLSADTATLATWDADGRRKAIRQIGAVRVEQAGITELIQNSDFDLVDADGAARYWEGDTANVDVGDLSNSSVLLLDDGESAVQALVRVSPVSNLRIEVIALRKRDDVGPPGTNVYGPVRVELTSLDTTTTHYLQPDGTWDTAVAACFSDGTGGVNVGGYLQNTLVATEDFPEAGRLSVRLLGAPGGPAAFDRVSIRFKDAGGLLVTTWVLSLGNGVGETVTGAAFDGRVEVWDGSAWAAPERWVSGGTFFNSMAEGMAEERLSMQGRTLRTFKGTVEGIFGPETALVLAAAPYDGASVVAADLDIDFETGTTTGTWIEQTTTGAA